MNPTIPPGLIKLLPLWGVNVDDFVNAYKALPLKDYTPAEWQAAVEALLATLGSTVTDPAKLWPLIAAAFAAGYDKDHGGLA